MTDSILKSVREGVGLVSDNSEFDNDLIPLINSAIAELNQNGVGVFLTVKDEDQEWTDLQTDEQSYGNDFFNLVPTFINLNVKLIFDPPPPSSVEFHRESVNKLLWRLKIAYEEEISG